MDPIIAIGEEAPVFQLTDLKGDIYSIAEMHGWIIVLNILVS